MIPILFQIDITGSQQYISLDNSDLTAFPGEKEILLQDGILYKVLGIKKETIKRED